MFAIENSENNKFASLPTIEEQIDIGRKILNQTQPDSWFSTSFDKNDFKYVSEDGYKTLLNEGYNEIYNLLKNGSNTVEVLAENVTNSHPEDSDQFFNLYDYGLQAESPSWISAEEEYSKLDVSVLADLVTENCEINQTENELIKQELKNSQITMNCIRSSLDVLGGDEDDFWSMIETGIGTAMDFSESVEFVRNWIEQNGIWDSKTPILELECDRSLTFEEDLPESIPSQEEVEILPADVTANLIQEDGLNTLTDEIIINYSIVRKNNCKHEVYFYVVDDINGTVEGLAPTENGYVEAALNNIIFPNFSNSAHKIESGTLQLDAGSLIVPLVIEEGSLAEVQKGNAKVYFSYAGAIGGDGLDRIKLLDGNVFGFNYQLDNDDNDIVIKLDNSNI
ncbi:hypothetical protein BC008_33700 [Mastigocoleus testarum BC008]|uniref:Uncharacterized protein n=2 Tax=Mastigocoleus TaxID=996924 RepID=A0A0V7ZWJ6_9CYAN|nr:hypothetical protein BC008_33700 [Mastigocoleus testarum BC008]